MKDKSKIREEMIEELSEAIRICSQKVKGRCRPSSSKPIWIRTLAYSCQTLNGILQSTQLDGIERRLEALENIKVQEIGEVRP